MALILNLECATHGIHRKPIIIIQIDYVLHTWVHKPHQSQLWTNIVLPIYSLERIFRRILKEKSSDIGGKFFIRFIAYFELSNETKRLHGRVSRIDVFL